MTELFSAQDAFGSGPKALSTEFPEVDLHALIRRAAGGDQAALADLYDATSRYVFGLALRILQDRSTAEEVLLDVYTQAWKQSSSYDPKRGAPLGWLMTIARSRAIDRLRTGKLESQRRESLESISEVGSPASNPEEFVVESERQRIVQGALMMLSPEQREVIELAYYGGMTHTEIAAKLQQPLGTVKTRTRLGMMKLREQLSQFPGLDA